ncbi:hypothetical protein HHK36_026793 [Tetracentron sinense]|uniref:Jacalin-type lectin domain-containing protein n=1 Tax=Tetracentron sinense TaxID=13715 RepID=A0A835D4Y2_TETSI|nr:hypothetical protein HHK36_026793 [Tetracentron sinense]
MDSAVSPIIDIICRLWDCCASRTIYICGLKENLDSLRSEMRKLRSERDQVKRKVTVAEEKQMRSLETVETWLQMVEELGCEVEVVIEEASQQLSKMCLGGCCPKNCYYSSSYKIGKRVVEKTVAVTKLITEGNFIEVADPLGLAKVEEMPSRPTVGMDSMFENVWKCLTEEDEVGIIGIYGMEGVGKTTLLKKINNEFLHRGTHDFDFVIWVEVSKESKVRKIQKNIGERLGLKLSEDESHDAVRARVIFNVLSKKRFVLLLDDIWDPFDFEDVGIPRPNAKIKSKVVFTTRSQAVSSRMLAQKNFKAECLGWNEAWDLFQMTVGKEALNSHHQILELAARVALECKGLPLTISSIGQTMAGKNAPHEWNDALKLLRKSASEEEEAISVGPWGEGVGTYWSHNAKGGITQITISHGSGIDYISFKTHDKGEMKFGGPGGVHTSSIYCDWPHEYLTSISGTYGTFHHMNGQGPIVVTSLRLITNKKEHGPFGLEFGTPFSLGMNGGVIVGFHGRSAQFMNAIGVYVKPFNCLSMDDGPGVGIEETLQYIQSKWGMTK